MVESADIVEPVAWIVGRPDRAGTMTLCLPLLRGHEEMERYQRNNPDETLVALYSADQITSLMGERDALGTDPHRDDIAGLSITYMCHDCAEAEADYSCHPLNRVVIVGGRVVCLEHAENLHKGTPQFKVPDIAKRVKRQRMAAAALQRRAEAAEAQLSAMRALLDLPPGWSLERGYRDRDEEGDYGWCVYRVHGGRNDREWDLIGFAETPIEALTAAHALQPPQPPAKTG